MNVLIHSVDIQDTTDFSLPALSYSIATAYNTCPTWGLVHYGLRKRFDGSGRAMALEAGSALHEVFAAARLYSVRKEFPDHFDYHLVRVFKEDAAYELKSKMRTSNDDWINLSSFGLNALHTANFYDDPNDKRRTLANLEEAALVYMRSLHGRQRPVWMQDVNDPTTHIGVELTFDLTFVFEYSTYTNGELHRTAVRYIGTIDAIHVDDKGKPYVEENKTGSRIDDAWAAGLDVSHQITGYMIPASRYTGTHIDSAVCRGVRIPQPRRASTDEAGIRTEYTTRSADERERFLQWLLYTHLQREATQGDVEKAPRFTHSCNRYFRPCSLIPFCKTSSAEERQDMLSTMSTTELSPSETAAFEKAND